MGPPGKLTGYSRRQAFQGPADVRSRRGIQDQHDSLVVRPVRRHRRDQIGRQVARPGRGKGDDLPGRRQHRGHGGDKPVGRQAAATPAGNVRDQRDTQDVGRGPAVQNRRPAQVGAPDHDHRQQQAGQGTGEHVTEQLRGDLADRVCGLRESHRSRAQSGVDLDLGDPSVEFGDLRVEVADLGGESLAVGLPRQCGPLCLQLPEVLGDLVTPLRQLVDRAAAVHSVLGEELLIGSLGDLDETYRLLLGTVPAGDRRSNPRRTQ